MRPSSATGCAGDAGHGPVRATGFCSRSDSDATPSYPSGYDTTRGTSTHPAARSKITGEIYDSVIAVAAIDSRGV